MASANLTPINILVQPCPWSDHSFVECLLPLPSAPQRADTIPCPLISCRNLKRLSPQAFQDFLSPLLTSIPPSNDLDFLVDAFDKVTSLAIDALAPMKEKRVKPETNNKHWFSDDIIHLRKVKRAAERKWRTHPMSDNKTLFHSAASDFKQAIIATKKDYYNKRIHTAQSSSKELFKVLKELEDMPVPSSTIQRDSGWCQDIQEAMVSKLTGHLETIKAAQTVLPPTSYEAEPSADCRSHWLS